MNTKFVHILNDLARLGEPISQVNQIRKVLRSLPDKYFFKRNVILEAHDLHKLFIEELCGNLIAYVEKRFSGKKEETIKDIILKVIHKILTLPTLSSVPNYSEELEG